MIGSHYFGVCVPAFSSAFLTFFDLHHDSCLKGPSLCRYRLDLFIPYDKRQQTVLVTKLSTIYYSGDSSKARTAEPGFDIRIDLLHGLFGFCPTTVIAATDCGLGGACIDSFACSKGCGLTGDPVTTWTW
ncbi:hypothetical protein L209DRAFT_752781 [Thermothelomyces heterothallicus CBS 203.75]